MQYNNRQCYSRHPLLHKVGAPYEAKEPYSAWLKMSSLEYVGYRAKFSFTVEEGKLSTTLEAARALHMI